MTIDRVGISVPKTPLEQPFAFSRGRVAQRAAPLEPILEHDRSLHPLHPLRADPLAEPWSIVDGRVPVPNGPGLGVEVRADAIERCSSS